MTDLTHPVTSSEQTTDPVAARVALMGFFVEHPVVAVAFSGGVDSSHLLHTACQAGADVAAYYVRSAFQPAFELADAERVAHQCGVKLRVLEVDVLADPNVMENAPDRCYACKTNIMGRITETAARDGYPLVIDGTNASDDAGDRPGMRALAEFGVRSPLRESGLSKAMIRDASREAGLFTWDKPAYACLATRIPTGMPISVENLSRVEQAESALAGLGFRDFRVRILAGAHARVQVQAADFAKATKRRAEIVAALGPVFDSVLLDLQPR